LFDQDGHPSSRPAFPPLAARSGGQACPQGTAEGGAKRAGRPQARRLIRNPVLIGCIGNVAGKADRCGNLYSTNSRLDQKIDAAVALMMAIGRSTLEDENQAGLKRFLSDPIAF